MNLIVVCMLCVLCVPAFASGVDLSKYEIGDIPEELGMVQVAKSKKLGRAILEPVPNQKSFINLNCDLKAPLEISFKRYGQYDITIKLIDENGKTYGWKLTGNLKDLSNKTVSRKSVGSTGWSDFRINISGRAMKFFCKDEFIASQVVPKGLIIKGFHFSFDKGYSAITDIEWKGASAPAEPVESPAVEKPVEPTQ